MCQCQKAKCMPKHRILIGILILAFLVQMAVLPTPQTPPLFAWMLSISHHLQMVLLFVGSGLVAWGFSQKSLVPSSQSLENNPYQQSAISGQPEDEGIQNIPVVGARYIASADPKNFEIPNQPAIASQESNTQKKNAFPFHFLTFNTWFHPLKAKSHKLRALLKSPLFWILLLALIVRLWDLELAITRFLDEILYMDAVVRLWGSPQPILAPFSHVTSFTWLFPYVQSWTAWLLGPSLTSVRIVSVIFGVAQVAAVHFLGKHLFDRKIALAAALVMATFPAQVHFSRIGINNIADPVFGTLALGFLVKGLRTQHRMDFVLAGYCLGLTQYFYEGGRLFFPLFVGLWLGWFWLLVRKKTAFSLPSRGNAIAFIGVALALLVPVNYVVAVRSDSLTPRLNEMFDNVQEYQLRDTNIALAERLQNTLQKFPMPLRFLISEPETGWFYGGDYPAILPPVLPFFIVGALLCLLRLRSPGGSLLIWWVLGASVGISFLGTPLDVPRYLVVFPAVALIMGVGIVTLLDLIQWVFAKITRHATTLTYFFIILCVVYITSIQAGYYALVHVPNYYNKLFVRDNGGKRLPDTDDALLRAAFLPANTTAILVSHRPVYGINMDTIPAFWGRKDLQILYVSPDQLETLLAQLPLQRHYAFFLEHTDVESLNILHEYFTLSNDPALYGSGSPYRTPQDMQMLLYFAPDGIPAQLFSPPPLMTPQAGLTDVAE